MAISYPLAIPNQEFASMTMRLKRVVGMSESSFTLQQQVYEHQGSRWEAEIKLPPLTKAQAKEWEVFFISLKGMRGTFLMGNPLHTESFGVTRLSGAVSARGTTCSVTGTNGDVLSAGTYFSIGSGDDAHIHQIIEGDTVASGVADLVIEPPFRTSYSISSQLNFSAPKGVWRLSSNEVEWNINSASMYGFTFSCVEAI